MTGLTAPATATTTASSCLSSLDGEAKVRITLFVVELPVAFERVMVRVMACGYPKALAIS